jgi:hypothetical protein
MQFHLGYDEASAYKSKCLIKQCFHVDPGAVA